MAFRAYSCPVPGADGRLWPGQTLQLVTELKMNVAGCCLYGVCFLPGCLWLSLEALSWKPGVQWLTAWLLKPARLRSALVLSLVAVCFARSYRLSRFLSFLICKVA